MANDKLTRTVRLVKMLDIIRLKSPSGGASLKDLIESCGVSERQIFRDLVTLDDQLKIPIIRPIKGDESKGKYSVSQSFLVNIGPETASAIFLSALKQKGSPLAVSINKVKDSLIAALFKNHYKDNIQDLEVLQKRIFIIEDQLLEIENSGRQMNEIIRAIIESKQINLSYFTPSRGEASNREVKPFGLISKHNNWYLVGFCLNSKEIRTFRLDLIQKIRALDKSFDYPEDFSINDYLGDSWGVFNSDQCHDVVIKVLPGIAYRFKNYAYHPSQKLVKENDDGSIIVSYCTSGVYEFLAWIMQWGDLVEILEPEELRQDMKKRLGKALKMYS